MKIKPIFLSLIILGACISCNDFLTEKDPNAIAIEDYLKTELDVQRVVSGLYQGIRSGNCIGEGSTLFMEERSDNSGRNDNQSDAGIPFQFNDFSIATSNPYLKNHWSSLYNVISRCNYLLTNIDGATIDNPETKQNYIAEAKFIRALMYFHLVRTWGDVPLNTEVLDTYDGIQAATIRAPKEQVYAQIIKDLTESLDCTLPNIQPTSGKGHTCLAAINGLLGQVYLTMGSNAIGDAANNFSLANQYLSACYNMKEFGQLSEIPYEEVFDVSKKNSCPEIIFQISYIQGDANYSSSVARNYQAYNETINSLYTSSKGASGESVKQDLVNEYEVGDLRGDFSVKFANDPLVQAYFVTKFRDTNPSAGVKGYGGNDWILMRYADIILMLAEVNMQQGNDAEAIAYLNEVRARAGMPTYETMQADPTYMAAYPTLKLAILHERRVELAFENHRWFDLLRCFNNEELVTFFHAKDQSDYGIANPQNFSTKDYYYPIPFDENKLNPTAMWQNPGY